MSFIFNVIYEYLTCGVFFYVVCFDYHAPQPLESANFLGNKTDSDLNCDHATLLKIEHLVWNREEIKLRHTDDVLISHRNRLKTK